MRGISAYPAEARAELIHDAIVAVASDESIAGESGRIEPGPDRIRIFFGDTQILSLYAVDAEIEDIELPLLAEAVLMRTAAAIVQYRESRSTDPLVRSSLLLLMLTAGAALLLYLSAKAFGWLNRFVTTRAERASQDPKAASRRLFDIEQLLLWLQGPTRALLILLQVTITLIWLNSALSLYPWTRPFATQVLDLVLDPLKALGTGLLEQIPNLAFLVVLALVVRFVLGGAGRIFDRIRRAH